MFLLGSRRGAFRKSIAEWIGWRYSRHGKLTFSEGYCLIIAFSDWAKTSRRRLHWKMAGTDARYLSRCGRQQRNSTTDDRRCRNDVLTSLDHCADSGNTYGW